MTAVDTNLSQLHVLALDLDLESGSGNFFRCTKSRLVVDLDPGMS